MTKFLWISFNFAVGCVVYYLLSLGVEWLWNIKPTLGEAVFIIIGVGVSSSIANGLVPKGKIDG